jgi:hypothetical protein
MGGALRAAVERERDASHASPLPLQLVLPCPAACVATVAAFKF